MKKIPKIGLAACFFDCWSWTNCSMYYMCQIPVDCWLSLTYPLLLSQQILWENCLNEDMGNDCLVSVDGTDFWIQEYSRRFYTKKFRSSGLQHEVAVSIVNGSIVWINGPYECDLWPEIKIFWDSFLSFLDQNECAEADDGYIGEAPQYVKSPKSFTNPSEGLQMQQRVCSRHETVNNRFKQWSYLSQKFCHDIIKHAEVFSGCCSDHWAIHS